MFKRFFVGLLAFLMLSASCASPGTVGSKPATGLLTPVIARTDAYIVVMPDALSPTQVSQYVAAKAVAEALPKDKRVAAAQSWLAVQTICGVHDYFVTNDPSLKEPHKSTYLRSTELLRKMYAEAFKASGESPPATPVVVPPVGPDSRATAVPNGDTFPRVGCPDGSCNR